MVKIAAVGTGSIFQRMHLPSYPSVEGAELVALVDVSEQSLKAAKRLMNQLYEDKAKELETVDPDRAELLRATASSIRTYSSLEGMLGSEQVDLLDVCTPPKYHEQVVEAIKRGVGVMVEKPMAYSYIEAKRIWDGVKENHGFYQHNEQEIFDPFYYTARKIVQGGGVGEPLLVSVSFAHYGPENRRWFWDWTVSGGGALVDMATHSITVGWFLAGFEKRITQVRAVSPHGISQRMSDRLIDGRFRSFDVEDDAHVELRLEGEKGEWVTLLAEGSWSGRDLVPFMVQGTAGVVRGDPENKKLEVVDAFGNEREVAVPKWNSFEMELSNAVSCVKDGTRSISDEDIGLQTTIAMGAAYLSELKGRAAVTPEEFTDFAETFGSGEELVKALIKGVKRVDSS